MPRPACFAIVASLALGPAGLAGCVRDLAAPGQTFWEASLEPRPEQPAASGSAAAISRDNGTEAGIEVAGLDSGTYGWSIRAGTCDDPGEVLGAEGVYPSLVVEAEPVSAETVTSALMVSGGTYHAQVTDGAGTIAACGDFVQVG